MTSDAQLNVSQSGPDLSTFHYVITATGYVLLVASLVAAVANGLVVYCGLRIFRLNHLYTHVLIITVTVADFFLALCPYALMSLLQIVPSLQTTSVCAFMEIAMWVGQTHSGMFLTAVNADRFVFYYWPRWYTALTGKYVGAVCAFVIVTSTGSITALWVTKAVYIENKCLVKVANDGRYPYIVLITTTCILPILSSLAVSTYLFVLTTRRRVPSGLPRRQGSWKRQVNTMLYSFATSLWTVVCTVPSRVFLTYYFAVYAHDSHSGSTGYTVLWLGYVSNVMMRAYPIVNPFITGFMCSPYRKELARISFEVKCVIQRLCRVTQ